MDRRGFLRLLGLGAAGAVAAPIIKPKAFFSFFTGDVWKPRPVLGANVLTLSDMVKRMDPNSRPLMEQLVESMANPPWVGILDDVPWMGEIKPGYVATIREG